MTEAEMERRALVPKERAALANAEEKLAALGPRLPFPHSSAVKGHEGLRELRPRGGNCMWRALYRRVGDEFIIASVCPEAMMSPKRFDAGCRAAERRLGEP